MKRMAIMFLVVAGLSGGAYAQPDSLQRRFTFLVAGHFGMQTGKTTLNGLPGDRLNYQFSPTYGLEFNLLTRVNQCWNLQTGIKTGGISNRFYSNPKNNTSYPTEPIFGYNLNLTVATIEFPIGIAWQSNNDHLPLHLALGWSRRWIQTGVFANERYQSHWYLADTSFTVFTWSWGDPIVRQDQLWIDVGVDLIKKNHKALRVGLSGTVGLRKLYEGSIQFFPDIPPTRIGSYQSWGHSLNLKVAYVFSPRPFIQDTWAQVRGEMRWYAALESGVSFNIHRLSNPSPVLKDHVSPDLTIRAMGGYELTPRWALEAGLAYMGFRSGVSYDLGNGTIRRQTGFRDPFVGVTAGGAFRVIDRPRLRLGLTGQLGMYFFHPTPGWLNNFRFTDQAGTNFLTVESKEERFRSTLPFVQAGFRPEWRVWKQGTAWLYLHAGAATGFGNVGGMAVSYQYNINPDPFSANYRFSGTALLVNIGTRVYIK